MVTPLFRISGVGSPFFNNYYAVALLDESRIVSDVFDQILQTSRNKNHYHKYILWQVHMIHINVSSLDNYCFWDMSVSPTYLLPMTLLQFICLLSQFDAMHSVLKSIKKSHLRSYWVISLNKLVFALTYKTIPMDFTVCHIVCISLIFISLRSDLDMSVWKFN